MTTNEQIEACRALEARGLIRGVHFTAETAEDLLSDMQDAMAAGRLYEWLQSLTGRDLS